MRQDARSLLERLGRKEFRYQEFEDPFADMELWPIFEALLRDANVVGEQASTIRLTEIQFKSAKSAEEPNSASPPQPAAPSPLFGRYAFSQSSSHSSSASPAGKGVNMRQFFGRLGEGK